MGMNPTTDGWTRADRALLIRALRDATNERECVIESHRKHPDVYEQADVDQYAEDVVAMKKLEKKLKDEMVSGVGAGGVGVG